MSERVFSSPQTFPQFAASTGGGGAGGGGDMFAANNLSELPDKAAARVNLSLGNVNNTSDASKPISTATAAALAGKQAAGTYATGGGSATGTNTGDQFTAMTSSRVLGRLTAGFGAAEELTFAQVKTALGLVKADVGLGSVDNTADSTKAVLSATKLTTARTINGQTFDGSANITINAVDSTPRLASSAVSAFGLTLIDDLDAATARTTLGLGTAATSAASAFQPAGTYATGTGSATGTNTGDQTTITGNAGSATVLQTARTINGVSFNGSANITVPAVDTATPRLAASAVSAFMLTALDDADAATARATLGAQAAGSYLTANQTVTLSGDVSGSGSTAITTTLATVNADVGTFGSSTLIPVITADGKGRITAISTVAAAGGGGSVSAGSANTWTANQTYANNVNVKFTDAGGSAAIMVAQADNNFIFYGTDAAGAARGIWSTQLRNSASNFRVYVNLAADAAIAAAGSITSSGAGIGYATGAGGAVTQLTSRTTGVTLNKASGAITLFSKTTTASLVESFTVTNSLVAIGDTINLAVRGTGIYLVFVTNVAAGSFRISVFTPAAVAAAEAPVINFAVVKAVAA